VVIVIVSGCVNDCCIVTFDGSRELMSTYWRTGVDRFSRAFCFYTAVHQLLFTVILSVTIFSLRERQVLWRLVIWAWQRSKNSHSQKVL